MKLKIKVDWDNPNHPLLKNSTLTVSADGNPITAVGGLLEIPQGAATARVELKFDVSFPARDINIGEPMANLPFVQKKIVGQSAASTVFDAGQSFLVLPNKLKPLKPPQWQGPNPLFDVPGAAASNGVVRVHVLTQFIDVTELWRKRAFWVWDYDADHKSGTELVILAWTGAMSSAETLLWFATIPSACKGAALPIGCIVYYPPPAYAYSSLDEQHEMLQINRFLLSPDASLAVTAQKIINQYWRAPQFNKYFLKFPSGKIDLKTDVAVFSYVRSGFEAALDGSGKKVVLLTLWPTTANFNPGNASPFGQAQSKHLPDLVEAAIRFLWGIQKIGQSQGATRLVSRLGLMGFSAGGGGLFPSVIANQASVLEVWSFDANGLGAHATKLIAWFNQNKSKGAMIRMTGGLNDHMKDVAKIMAATKDAAVTGSPSSSAFWSAAGAAGASDWWNFTLAALPPLLSDGTRKDTSFRHQFALFGGDDTSPPRAVNYFAKFLKDSGF